MEQKNHNGQSNQSHQGQGRPVHTPASAQAKPHNGGMSFLLRKSEKLTTALYMVTDIMPDKEPMKWKLRETGVELLSDMTISSSSSPSERVTLLREAMKKTERIVSYLDITQSARMLSEMNASVLKKEYAALKDAIETEWTRTNERGKNIFSETFFEVPHEPERALPEARSYAEPAPVSFPQKENAKEPDPDEVKRTSTPPTHSPVQHSNNVREERREQFPRPEHRLAPTEPRTFDPARNIPRVSSPRSQDTTESRPSHQGAERAPIAMPERPPRLAEVSPTSHARSDVDRGDRRTIILALIKQKPALTVKDITKSIPDVSEKTIQRELLAMVANGVLIKKGERRWSTYSLRENA